MQATEHTATAKIVALPAATGHLQKTVETGDLLNTASDAPVNVWAYWESNGKPLPSLVEMCIASWRRYLDPAQFSIRILDRDDLAAYDVDVPIGFDDLFYAAVRSDVVRCTLLAKYGGLWMDASTYLPSSMSWLRCWCSRDPDATIDCNSANRSDGSDEAADAAAGEAEGEEAGETRCTMFAFHEPTRPYPENGFLFVPSGRPSRIMKIWRDTLVDILTTVPVEKHPSHGANGFQPTQNYFFMFDAWMWLRSTNAEFEQLARRGRYKFKNFNWNPALPLDWHTYVIKFTSHARKWYAYFRFPLLYVWILPILLFVVGIITAATRLILRRRVRRVR